jgi:hypothetical protein
VQPLFSTVEGQEELSSATKVERVMGVALEQEVDKPQGLFLPVERHQRRRGSPVQVAVLATELDRLFVGVLGFR